MVEVTPEVFKVKATSTTPISSLGQTAASMKKIFLGDWWLWKPGGKGIGVGGYAIMHCRGQAKRTFHSAAITKRHDSSTLETSDGFTIFISGLLNRVRTTRNGFLPEVCCYFISGFPYNWEDYLAQSGAEMSSCGSCDTGPSGLTEFNRYDGENYLFPECSNGFSVARILDLLKSTDAECEERIVKDFVFSDLRKLDAVAAGVSVAESSINQIKCCSEQNFVNPDGQMVVSPLSPCTPLDDVQISWSNNSDNPSSHAVYTDEKVELGSCSSFAEALLSNGHVLTKSKDRSERIRSSSSRHERWVRSERVCTRSMTRGNELVGKPRNRKIANV